VGQNVLWNAEGPQNVILYAQYVVLVDVPLKANVHLTVYLTMIAMLLTVIHVMIDNVSVTVEDFVKKMLTVISLILIVNIVWQGSVKEEDVVLVVEDLVIV